MIVTKTSRMSPAHRLLSKAVRHRKHPPVYNGIYTADAYARHFRDEMGAEERSAFGFKSNYQSRVRWLERGCTQHLCYRTVDSEIKEFNGGAGEGAGRFRGIMTTSAKDRDGDVLLVSGAEIEEFARIGSLLYMHVPFQVIGKPIEVEKDARLGRIIGTFELARTQLGEEVAYLIDFGALRTLSIGFTPLEFEPLNRHNGKDDDEYETPGNGMLIPRYRLLECSVVSVPANPEAVITAVATNKCKHPFVKLLAERCRKEIKNNEATVRVKRLPSLETKAETKAETKFMGGEMVTGSWEWTQHELREKLAAFLQAAGIAVPENAYVCIAFTFGDYAVICISAMNEEELFYRCDWGMVNGEPAWINMPVPVELEITTEIRERLQRERHFRTGDLNKTVVPFASMPKADEDMAWDAAAARSRLENYAKGDAEEIDLTNSSHRGRYQRGFTYVRESGERLGDYVMPHHDIVDGELKTVWRGVVAAMAAVHGGRGGVDMSDDDRQRCHNHLMKHYEEFGEEAPEFKSVRFLETKRGRVLSSANETRLRDVSETLSELIGAAELSRTQRSVLRQCIADIGEVLSQVSGDED